MNEDQMEKFILRRHHATALELMEACSSGLSEEQFESSYAKRFPDFVRIGEPTCVLGPERNRWLRLLQCMIRAGYIGTRRDERGLIVYITTGKKMPQGEGE